MNLSSFALASTLRLGVLASVAGGLLLGFQHLREKALFERTSVEVLQAMTQQLQANIDRTRCLHVPRDVTLSALVREGWLRTQIVQHSPWRLTPRYRANASGRVIVRELVITAPSNFAAIRLRSLAHQLPFSWTFQGRTLTLQAPVPGPTGVERMEFNPKTACFSI